MKDVFRSGDSSKKFKIAEGQWYRYASSYVSPAYHLLQGFPFIQEPPSGDLQERVLIRHYDYDQCFKSVQLLQWNSQVKFNVFFFQAEDGIRDYKVTGVQTCALPISSPTWPGRPASPRCSTRPAHPRSTCCPRSPPGPGAASTAPSAPSATTRPTRTCTKIGRASCRERV